MKGYSWGKGNISVNTAVERLDDRLFNVEKCLLDLKLNGVMGREGKNRK